MTACERDQGGRDGQRERMRVPDHGREAGDAQAAPRSRTLALAVEHRQQNQRKGKGQREVQHPHGDEEPVHEGPEQQHRDEQKAASGEAQHEDRQGERCGGQNDGGEDARGPVEPVATGEVEP